MMEFNFLNVSGNETGGFEKEESRGGRDDSAFSVGSAVLSPLLDNASPLQQSMLFKTLQEQKPENVFFNPISATAFRHFSAVEAFESNQKAIIAQASQNQDMKICSASTPHVNDVRFSSVLHPPISNTMNSPFSKFHGSSSGHNSTGATVNHQPFGSDVLKSTSFVVSEVGAIFPRKMTKPATTSAQLTIFYAGSVNVFDDVPCDKAQNVLLMASEGCKAAANAVDSRAEAPALPFTEGSVPDHLGVAQTPKITSSHVVLSGLSRLSLASHSGNQNYVPVPTDDKVGAQTMETSIQVDPLKTINTSMGAVTAAIILPIAVPQSRKASLARFLDKRKERASRSKPYSCDKGTLDNSHHF